VSTIFTLNDTPAAKRFSYFRDVVESFYIPIGLACDKPEKFNAWVKGNELGGVSVGTCFLSEQRVSRKREHIVRSEDDRIKLIMPLAGAIASSQDSNSTVIRPGEFYVTDPTRTYEECIVEDMTFVYMLLPRDHVVSQVGLIERITATRFDLTQPYARLAADFVKNLISVANSLTETQAKHAASIATDLITMVLWEHAGGVPSHSTIHRSTLFHRAKTFIDEHLEDWGLSLAKVAAAVGVSTRYLSGLLAEGGFSYQRYVLEQRLCHSAKKLVDPRLVHLTIEQVARECSFGNSAHFSRAFRARFGMSPREYRASSVKDSA
jgi:AraC-like DNA-binding protein